MYFNIWTSKVKKFLFWVYFFCVVLRRASFKCIFKYFNFCCKLWFFQKHRCFQYAMRQTKNISMHPWYDLSHFATQNPRIELNCRQCLGHLKHFHSSHSCRHRFARQSIFETHVNTGSDFVFIRSRIWKLIPL